MPRKNTDEVIADLEQKLEEAKARAAASRDARIAKLDEQIELAKQRVTKATDAVAKLQAERDALSTEATVMTDQPPLPVDTKAVKVKPTADVSA
jgi:predicted  nucleic acid-binding Zn-ribbon protein